MDGQRIGVVGAGIVGCGVAHSAAGAGLRVVILDRGAPDLERARRALADSVHLQRLLGGPKASPTLEELWGRLTLTTDWDDLAGATFVIESVTEDWDTKAAVLGRLDALCPPATVFASTTSAIPITRLGSATARPDRVLGLHFMNPVPLKPMVELIPGARTSQETLALARDFLAALGKTPVQVSDSPGFVTNRVLMLTVNEAMRLVEEGVAAPADIDRIFKGCFGHRMGPLETADMIGLDTVLQSLEVLQDAFGDERFRPCDRLRRMVEAGRLGRKSGGGFHSYQSPSRGQ